jgi:hypothetical protein
MAMACAVAGVAAVCASPASAGLVIPGTADIWAWNGGPLPYDAKGTSTVFDIAPVLVLSDLTGIHAVTISFSGATGNCPGCYQSNGWSYLVSHSVGAANGVPNLTAPLNSLVGAWIDPADYANNVAFEVGQGATFLVPAGVTRLYLGSMDAHEWNNNVGQFEVILRLVRVPEPLTLWLFGAGLIGAAAIRRRRRVV